MNKPNHKPQRVVAQREVARYKLVVFFKAGQGNNSDNRPRVFYSYFAYDRKGDLGKTHLKRLVTAKYKGMYITALLYNNQTRMLLEKWIGSIEEGRQSA